MRAADQKQSRAAGKSERRAHRVATFGRYGVWAIPIFAVFTGLLPRAAGAFSTDPAVYARYLATDHGSVSDLVRTLGAGLFGVLSIVALAALLSKARGHSIAFAGMLAALAGSVLLILEVGSVVIRNERMRGALLGGDFSRIAGNAHATSRLVPAGIGLLTLGWILLGIAVFMADGLNRSDGVLLIISAPMIYAGGLVLNMIPVLGAFLLVAAGLGIGFAADKVLPAGTVKAAQRVPHERPQSALARFVDTPDDPETATIAATGPTETVAGDSDQPAATQLRGVSTSWSVTRAKSDDIVAPPPSAKNLKPMATTRKNSSVLNGASIKTTGLNGKSISSSGGAGGAAIAESATTEPANMPAETAEAAQRRAEDARRGKAKNRTKPPGGPATANGKPDGSKGPATGRE
jgi:Amt family ammonium transporter